MSTNPSLPAGFFITSINGQRCTAVPRASTTLTGSVATEAAAQPPTTTTPVATTTPAAAISLAASTTAQIPASTPGASDVTSSSPILTDASESSSIIPQAQSEVSSSTTQSFTILNGSGFTSSRTSSSSSHFAMATSTSTTSASVVSSSSSPKTSPGPIIGGVLGSLGFLALVAFLLWFFRRRRQRDSLLTPLGTGQRSSFYDNGVSTEKSSKWKYELGYQKDRLRDAGSELKDSLVGLGAALKTKMARNRSDTPSVNLNRGTSQFLDGPIPQHSRNNSTTSTSLGRPTLKERAADLWENVGDKFAAFKWRLPRKKNNSDDMFGSARGMNEKSAGVNNIPPSVGALAEMNERDLHLQAARRRASLAAGSLGLNLGPQDPFADQIHPALRTNANANPFADPSNPFSDPLSRPEPSIAKTNTYVADIRRSRGQSIDATTTANNASASNTASMYRPPSTLAGSRYPSTIAPSRDSYRDTVFSSFSANTQANGRKGKGRSDPFDLERPELWRPKTNSTADMYPPPLNSARFAAPNAKAQGILGMDVGGQPGKRVTYNSSKYSSGVSALSEWGDPGPDVAPGSLGKEGALGNGVDIYQAQQKVGGGEEVRRSTSKASSTGVGKAM